MNHSRLIKHKHERSMKHRYPAIFWRNCRSGVEGNSLPWTAAVYNSSDCVMSVSLH